MKIETILANFVAYENLKIDNKSIMDFCYYQRQKNPEGRIISNKGGWQSDDIYLHQCNHPEVVKLISIINDRSKIISGKLHLYDKKNITVNNFWININKISNSNNLHFHDGALFAAVYYVKVPAYSGNIIMMSGNVKLYDECIKPGYVEKYNEFNSSSYTYNPVEGDLLFLPAWLEHKVENNNSKEDRISIAFNLAYTN